jgi:hypothetical protein
MEGILGFPTGASGRVGPPETLDKSVLAGHNAFNAREIERMQSVWDRQEGADRRIRLNLAPDPVGRKTRRAQDMVAPSDTPRRF